MSEQNHQKNNLSQPTKDKRADHFKEITDFAKSEIIFVRLAYKWLISLVAIVAIVGISVGIWFTHKSSSDLKQEWREEVERLGRQVNIRIDEEFRKENIHKMVEEKARERIDNIADKLIEKQIADKISPQIKSAEEQLEKIKQRNEITRLGDKGILEASRDSFEELGRIKDKADNPDIIFYAKAEIARIESYWLGLTRVGFELTLDKIGEKKKQSDCTTHELSEMLLTHKDFRVRVLAARELAVRREKGVPQALLKCMETERDLEVAQNALDAFGQVTGFGIPGVFAFDRAQIWWNEHSKEVNAKLKDPK